MSSLSSQYKGFAQVAPNLPGAIRGRKNLVREKQYVRKCVFPDDGHHRPCSDVLFTYEADIDGRFFKADSSSPLSYSDCGVEPYTDQGKITGWHKTHFVVFPS